MFVYAIKISGIPPETDAKSILKQHFPDSESELGETVLAGDQITIYQPVQNGELFFNKVLRKMGESFTELARQDWQFLVLRKRFDSKYKLVASYDEGVKIGRRAWRDERQRVEAASESLESFLCKEANVEDMEVLRPLFPQSINQLLRKKEENVTEGAEVLQLAFPTLKSSESRRIFSAMQILQERRAGKWKNRFGCAWVSLYFIMSIFLAYVITDGLTDGLSWNGILAAPVALILALVPVVGSIAAFLSATKVWDWPTAISLIIFFAYYIPIAFIIVRIGFAAFKGEGIATWNKLFSKQSVDDDE